MRETAQASIDFTGVPHLLARPSKGEPSGVVVWSEIQPIVADLQNKLDRSQLEIEQNRKLAGVIKRFTLTGGIAEVLTSDEDGENYTYTTFRFHTGFTDSFGNLTTDFEDFAMSSVLTPFSNQGFRYEFHKEAPDFAIIIFQSITGPFPNNRVRIALARIPESTFSDGLELFSVAARKNLFYGSATENSYITSDLDYADILKREVNVIVPELSLKWNVVRPDAATFAYTEADELVDWAFNRGMSVKGHTLVWHQANPPWLEAAITPVNAITLMDEHIQNVVSRYSSKITKWDVVNEPVDSTDATTLNPSIWYNAFGGETYIDHAFNTAKTADSDCKLYLNEFGIETTSSYHQNRRATLLSLISRLKKRNVPLDGLGIQSHISAGATFDELGLRAFIEALVSDFKLDVEISELDVDDRALPADSQRDALVGQTYFDYLSIVLKTPIKGIIGWGLSDKYNWLNANEPRIDTLPQRSYPFDENQVRKVAHQRIRQAIDARLVTPLINLLSNPSFESGTEGWYSVGAGTVTQVASSLLDFGTHSLSITNREASWDGIAQDLVTPPLANQRYFASGWAKSQSANTRLRFGISAKQANNKTQYRSSTDTPINPTDWTYLFGEITGFTGVLTGGTFFAETIDGSEGYSLENLKLFTLI